MNENEDCTDGRMGYILKKLRLMKGLSMPELSLAVRISKSHLWKLERGTVTSPTLRLLKKLADYYDVTVGSIIGESS